MGKARLGRWSGRATGSLPGLSRHRRDAGTSSGSFPTPAARYTGWILAKDNRALQDQLIGVINELIDDGTWTELLAKWGVSESDAVIPPLRNEQPTNEGS